MIQTTLSLRRNNIMKITFVTLFPEYMKSFFSHSIIKKSINLNLVDVNFINPRDFSENNKIDDTVYGGGDGMLLMIEPLIKSLRSIKDENAKIILTSPQGQKFTQAKAKELSKDNHIVIISGNYEGIDSRIKNYIDEEISIGDFVLTGGELPSLIISDAIIRLIPGVIKKGSRDNESFENNLLEHDHFTKPRNFEGYQVPEVLLNGNHKEIEKWRKKNSIEKTINNLLKEKEKL